MHLVTVDQNDHQILHAKAQSVKFPLDQETQKQIQEMETFFNTLASPFTKPAGLAAPQIGISKQIIIIQIPKEAKIVRKDVHDELPPTFFINPSYTIIEDDGTALDWEACYSVPNKMGEVERSYSIHYQAYTLSGEKVSGIARGFFARVFQHEVGHLDGQLYLDLLAANSRFGELEEMMAIRKQEFNLAK